jgi:hypothetical protein
MITKYKDINNYIITVSTKVDKIVSVDNGVKSITKLLKVKEDFEYLPAIHLTYPKNYPKNYASFKDEDTFHSELRGQLLADNLEIL